MKFKAEKNKLSEAVLNASKACAVKSAFNSLDGVLLSLKRDKLTVTGYDLEMGIKITMNVIGEVDGEIIVDARLFGDIIKKMPSTDTISIEVLDEKKVIVKSGKAKFEIQGVSGSNYPNIIELNDNISIELDEYLLKRMLSQVNHATSHSDMNPILVGTKFEIENKMLYLVTSDSYRLALCKEPIDYDNISFIIPEKTVTELIRNLSDEEENKVKIVLDRNQICVNKENYIILSRLLDGKFVDYNRIMNFIPERTAIINVKDTIYSLERASLLITDKFKSPVISTFTGKGEEAVMHLFCKTNIGELDDYLPVNYETVHEEIDNEKPFAIGYNPKYMIDALKNTNCDEVKLMFLSELNPIKIVSLEEDNFLFVVVPVRMK